MKRISTIVTAAMLLLCSGCAVLQGSPQPIGSGQLKAVALNGRKLKVMATTTIIGDLAANVGGEHIELMVLLPINSDPHSFQPTPEDAARVNNSDLLLTNGVGLEEFLAPLLRSAGSHLPVVDLSEGVTLRTAPQQGNAQPATDPHYWTSPANAIIMVRNIARALSVADPGNASAYAASATAYEAQLQDLDTWVRSQIETIPADKRKMVISHDSLGYYADRYGLQLIGSVIPGFSSLSEPSAQQLAALEDAIRKNQVSTVFVENTVNPAVSDRVAQDVGVKVVALYSDALGAPGSGASTYIEYIRYNTTAIVQALK